MRIVNKHFPSLFLLIINTGDVTLDLTPRRPAPPLHQAALGGGWSGAESDLISSSGLGLDWETAE